MKRITKMGYDWKLWYNIVRKVYTTQPIIDPRDMKLKWLTGIELTFEQKDLFGELKQMPGIFKGTVDPITGEPFNNIYDLLE